MKYRTIENSTHAILRKDRRTKAQSNEFPLEDLNGNIVINERRTLHERRSVGMEVTETKISQEEFQIYFANCLTAK